MSPLTRLEDLMPQLDRINMDILGETILYRASGDAEYREMGAYVDYRDAIRPLEGAQVIQQDISVEVLKADLTAKPVGADRIRLPLLPGRTFRPLAPRSGESGTHWEFEVKDVADG